LGVGWVGGFRAGSKKVGSPFEGLSAVAASKRGFSKGHFSNTLGVPLMKYQTF